MSFGILQNNEMVGAGGELTAQEEFRVQEIQALANTNEDEAIGKQSGSIVKVTPITGFLDLSDVPSTYAGSSSKGVRVNAGETGLEFYTISTGTSGSGTANEIAYWVDSNTLGTLAVTTYPSLTELSYVKGVTSAIQTQLNGKQASMGADDNYVTDAEKTAIGTIGVSTPTMRLSANFDTSARYSQASGGGSGAIAFDTYGVKISTGATASGYATLSWRIIYGDTSQNIFKGSPLFSCHIMGIAVNQATNNGELYVGIGEINNDGAAGHTFTSKHIGFKIIKTGGTATLYATQGDATTENVSASLTTLVNYDEFDLIFKVNGTTSVDYYWRKNSGNLSSAVNLTSNLPTANGELAAQFSVNNKNTATAFNWYINGASYER